MVLSAPVLTLAPGASDATWTGTYTITQADIDRGFVANSATATGGYTDADGAAASVSDVSGTTATNDTPTRAVLEQGAAITLVKTVDTAGLSSPAAVGDELTYAFTVANTGNTTLTGVALVDDLPGMALSAPALTLAPGASDATWTGTYTITQADIDRGFVANSATATGGYTDADGAAASVSDVSGTTAANDTPTRAVLEQGAAITLVKTVDTAGLSSPAAVGDELTYAFTVANTGNTTLTGVSLTDALPGMALSAPVLTLAPGASNATWTGTYTITQADIDRGFVANSATATGGYTDADGAATSVSDVSGTTATNDTPTRAVLEQGAAITLVKAVDTSGLSSPAAVGDELAYAFTVANTGNTTLTGVALVDLLPGMDLDAPVIAMLAPGALDATWTGTYTITQADIDRGFVANSATATGNYTHADGEAASVSDVSGTTATNDMPTRAVLEQGAAITLVKTVDTAGLSSPAAVGDELAYAFTVANTGNTTLAGVALADALPGMVLDATTIPTLAPGASDASWTGTYTITQADIDRGFVANSATATGGYTDADGAPASVSDVSGTTATNDTPTRAVLEQGAAITLVKAVDTSALSSPAAVGDVLTYAFTVANAGNTTLTGVVLADNLPGMVLDAPTIATLAPGASDATWTGSYALTQADIDRGFVANSATATGGYTDSTGAPDSVSDASGTLATNDTPTRAVLEQAPSIALIKTVDTGAVSSPAAVGEDLSYGFTVVNTGNTTLTAVTLTDALPGMALSAPVLTLAPGASDASWTGTYALTQADLDRGWVENSAVVRAVSTDASGADVVVEDTSGTALANDTPTRALLGQAGSLVLIKTVDASAISTPAQVGDELAYAFTVANTGNTTLTGVALSDDLVGLDLDAPTIATLAPGASDATWTGLYALTQADIDRGFVENSATATAAYADGTGTMIPVQDVSGTTANSDAPTVADLVQSGAVALVKTVDASGLSTPAQVGDVLAYTFRVENTGNTTLTDVALSDPMAGLALDAPSLATLAPGDSDASWTAAYALTQADLDRGFVENQALVEANTTDGTGGVRVVDDRSGTDTANDTPTRVDLARTAALALIKTVDASGLSTPAQVGDVLAYSFVVENTGTTTLTAVTLADALDGLVLDAPALPALAPGASDASWSGTYALTQADLDRGFVENSATATGTYTDEGGVAQTTSDVSGSLATNDTPTRAVLDRLGAVALIKTADASGISTPPAVGDVVRFGFEVRNTGSTTLSNLALTDALEGAEVVAPPLAALAPGESDATWTGTYALTQADLDRGFVENSARVDATYPGEAGAPVAVSDTSGTAIDNDTPVRVALGQRGSVALIKTVDASGLSEPVQVGDVLTYAFRVENTGNTTLTDLVLTDALDGIVLDAPTLATLAPGAFSTAWTGSYTLTQADLDRGAVENSATVTGQYTDPLTGPQVAQDTSGTDASNDAPTRVVFDQEPGIVVIKRAVLPEGGITAVGDTIRYTFEIRNTGGVTLTDIRLTDDLPGLVLTGGPIASLAPGAVDTTTYTATYAVTAADFSAAMVENQATVSGAYVDGSGASRRIEARSGTDATNTTPTVVEIGQPALDLAISIADIVDRNRNGRTDVGDGVVFRFTVTNTGNVPLTGVTIRPDSLSLDLPDLVCVPVDLAVGETAVLECTGATYTITPADAQAGSIRLTGTAEGTAPGAVVVSDESTAAAVPVEAPVSRPLVVEKTTRVDEVRIGDAVEWTITVRQAEGASLPVDVAIVDALPAGFALREGSARLNGRAVEVRTEGRTVVFPTRALAPGATLRATLSTTVLSSAGAGRHTNRAWANNLDGARISNTAEAVVRVALDPVFGCGTVVGRVFGDGDGDGAFNHNGQSERGLAGVRLVAPNGVSVVTDQHGRFNLPCEALPSSIGSNFQLKLDERTLPVGSVVASENPRVVRLTAGMVTRLDFAVQETTTVRVALTAKAFPNGRARPELSAGLRDLAQAHKNSALRVEFVYTLAPGEDTGAGRAHMEEAQRMLRAYWKGPQRLRTSTTLLR